MEKIYGPEEQAQIAISLSKELALTIKNKVDRDLKRDLVVIGAWETLEDKFCVSYLLNVEFIQSTMGRVRALAMAEEPQALSNYTDDEDPFLRLVIAATTAYLGVLFFEKANRSQRQHARSQAIKQLREAKKLAEQNAKTGD